MGYYVRCRSEPVYTMFTLEEHKVFGIGVAKVDDGHGTMNQLALPSLSDGIPMSSTFTKMKLLQEVDFLRANSKQQKAK